MPSCRVLDHKLNVFKGFFSNPYFYMIIFLVSLGQVIIVLFGDVVFKTVSLSGTNWAICIGIGFVSLPWGVVIRLVPNGIFTSIFGDPNHPKKISPENDGVDEAAKSLQSELKFFKSVRGTARLSTSRRYSKGVISITGSHTSLKAKSFSGSDQRLASAISITAIAGGLGGYLFLNFMDRISNSKAWIRN